MTLAAAVVAATVALNGSNASPLAPPDPRQTSTGPLSPAIAAFVVRCQRSDCGSAAAEFAKWDVRRVAIETPAAESVNDLTLATLVVLHTGAAIAQGAFGGVQVESRTDAPHFASALSLVGLLTRRAKDNPGLRAFCSNWYILAASLWCSGGHHAAAERTLRGGHGLLGDDPEFLLAAATVDEALMGPYQNAAAAGLAHGPAAINFNVREMKTTSGGFLTAEYLDAERRLRKVLSLRPDLVEARLRLGRVYFVLDRFTDAQPEFERVLAEAPRGSHPYAAAVAALFLGQLYERAGRFDDARKAYETAIGIAPVDQAPHLALGHLLIASGRVDDGWAVVRRMLQGPGGAPKTSPDSYHQYRMGQYWQASLRISALEGWVRR
jgi:tetratricopeptide (TPR) repeat protein